MSANRQKRAVIAFASMLIGLSRSASTRDLEEILKDKGVITSEEARESQSQESSAAPAAAALPSWVGWFTPFGDVRLRNESFFRKGDNDRVRQRFRLRLGTKVKPAAELELGFKLASGNANDPISNNQTFTDEFTFKNVNITNAYVKLTPAKSIGLERPLVTLLGGKFDVPFYSPPTPTGLVFDRDLTPEGFAESLQAIESKEGFVQSLALNLGQWILEENSSTGEAAIYGFQGVGRFAIGDALWSLGVSDYKYVDASSIAVARNKNTSLNITNTVTLSDGTVVAGRPIDPTKFGPDQKGVDAEGNPITIKKFNNPFNDLDAGTDLLIPTGLKSWPLKLFFDYVKNTEASSSEDQGFEGGATIGAGKESGDAWFTYAYERLETDAVVSAFGESDFGHDGGTNTKAHILQVGYVFTPNLSALSTAYIDEPIESVSGRSDNTDYRWQIDVIAKF
jgi:hypothetical protein